MNPVFKLIIVTLPALPVNEIGYVYSSYVVSSIRFQTFFYRHLKLSQTLENSVCYCYTSYILYLHLTNFYDFRFKWTATAAIGIHPTKAWLSQMGNFKNAIEHQFLSGIRDSRKAVSLWGMMRGVGGVRKSIHQSWLAKRLGYNVEVLREFRKRCRQKRPALFKSGQWHF